jgi:hypothetical protein
LLLDLFFLDPLLKLILVDEGDLATIWSLHEDFSIESALILKFDITSALLTIDDVSEVNFGLFRICQVHLSLLASANKWDVYGPGLRE